VEIAKVDSRGRILLPRSVRKALGLKPRDSIVIKVEGDHAILKKAYEPKAILEKLLGDITFIRELRKAAEGEALREIGDKDPRDMLISTGEGNRRE